MYMKCIWRWNAHVHSYFFFFFSALFSSLVGQPSISNPQGKTHLGPANPCLTCTNNQKGKTHLRPGNPCLLTVSAKARARSLKSFHTHSLSCLSFSQWYVCHDTIYNSTFHVSFQPQDSGIQIIRTSHIHITTTIHTHIHKQCFTRVKPYRYDMYKGYKDKASV